MATSSNSGSVHDDHRRSSIEDYPGDPFTKASDLIEPTVGTVRVSPNSGKKLYTPAVSDSFIPNTDMSFCNLNESYDFYVRYTKEAGFGVRKGTKYELRGVCKIKQYVCSKAGYKQPKPFDSLSDSKAESNEGNKKVKRTRRRASQRTGCKAQICLRINDKTQKYDVYKFIEDHNHPLVSAADINFLAAYRQLNYSQMQNICIFTQHNIGPARAFSIMRTMYGGFENLGATKEDMKNFKRRLNFFIGEYDADMVVNTLMDKKEFLPDFSFEYTTDEAGQLTALFWADGMMKQTYAYFGDCISFDSTFQSNKHQMVFVPFTGINNHHMNVTFAGALLSKETTESYCWLLNCFKKTFKKPPNVIVTDQDPAMKQAIQIIFPHSRHRFCMWHIMKKVADKVGPVLSSNESFKRRICDIVWTDSITPETFEMEWIRMIHDFNLVNNYWLTLIFELRFMWIPAYYHNQPMSGLMRTTSRSESENHFFGQVTNAQLTLLEFIRHFETAIESQRYTHRKNDHDTRFTNPEFCSNLEMEHEAAELYTRNIFYDVQYEIHDSIHHCISQSTTREDDFCKFAIRDTSVADENYCLEVKLNEIPRTGLRLSPRVSNDLFVFSHGDKESVSVIAKAIKIFSDASGLKPNMAKSQIFLCNVPEREKQCIRTIIPMEEGKLPVKYLGVPLVSAGLKIKDCNFLIDRVDNRIKNWKNKYLSYAGRLQLIKAILSSMHVYWASIFLLPPAITKGIERCMRNFLWQQGRNEKGKSKIAWKDCCHPKDEGGIGITRVKDMNKALITALIWRLITNKKSIWVKWTYDHRIKNKNFWEVPIKQGVSKSWKDILQVRDIVRPFVTKSIGNGYDTSAWYEKWSRIGPIAKYVSYRAITSAGFDEQTKVKDIIDNQRWKWPENWANLLPVRINPPILNSNKKDENTWTRENGTIVKFSVKQAWEAIRQQKPKVSWYSGVWYPQAIPRMSFHIWLVIHRRLQTQDRMAKWAGLNANNTRLLRCSLCKQGPDSHEHLFFECNYAIDVWTKVKNAARMSWLPDKWANLEDILIRESESNKVRCLISKLLIAASSYYIWQECNKRLFTDDKRDQTQMAETIISIVRLKLVSCKFRKKNTGFEVLNYWKNVRYRSESMEEDS